MYDCSEDSYPELQFLVHTSVSQTFCTLSAGKFLLVEVSYVNKYNPGSYSCKSDDIFAEG